MITVVAMFRAINVGGRNVLPMKGLVALLEELGACRVRTYIQSGNAVFDLPGQRDRTAFPGQLAEAIASGYGFQPAIILMGLDDLDRAINDNPFPDAADETSRLHFGFLASQPDHPDLQKLETLRAPSERFHLSHGVFYLDAPEGVGRSKLAAGAERLLGVAMTDRNWKTVRKIRELADASETTG
ncbi:hypothetical protein GMSM_35210 [Geomonas sp. Red276]